jgi:hypothetical protein
MIKKKEGLTILFLTLSKFCLAQAIVTDRPDQTESSSTIPKKSLQLETGFLFGSSNNDAIKEQQILAPSILSRYGLIKGIELRLVTQFESAKNKQTQEINSGFSDLEVGTKVQLFKKETSVTEIAFLSHLVLPTGPKQLTNDKIGTINKLSISHQLTESVGMGYNVGYNYFGFGNGDFTYSFALGIGLTDTLGIYFEPFGEVLDIETHEASFDAGLTYLLKDNIQFDLSYGTGLNHNMNYISVGCSVNIAKLIKD